MGYKSKADFEKAINAEMRRMQYHSEGGRERLGKPKPQAEKPLKLRGEPGSAERWQQVAEMTDDPTLISEMAYESIGVHLQNALHAIHAYENSDYFDGENYPQEVIDQF